MKPETAKLLLEKAQEFREDPEALWDGMGKEEFFLLITNLTNKGTSGEATKLLEQIASEEVKYEIPQRHQPLVEKIEKQFSFTGDEARVNMSSIRADNLVLEAEKEAQQQVSLEEKSSETESKPSEVSPTTTSITLPQQPPQQPSRIKEPERKPSILEQIPIPRRIPQPLQRIAYSGARAGTTGLVNLARGALSAVGRIGLGFTAGTGSVLDTIGVILAIVLIILVLIVIFIGSSSISRHQKAYLGFAQELIEGSQFIKVIKTTPQTTFATVPGSVSYTITVEAPKEILSNVHVEDTISVSGETPMTLPGGGPWDIPQITQTTPWTQSFNVSLPGTIRNSFIINTVTVTADVVGQPKQTSSTSLSISVGAPPQDCPSGWPIAHGWIDQGPDGTYSHNGLEAIDAEVPPTLNYRGQLKGVHDVFSTHKGTVVFRGKDGYDGNYVKIRGVCEGNEFFSLHVHFDTMSVVIGQEVVKGTVLGKAGDTGFANSVHDHYAFQGLKMQPPYIPVAIPRGCVGFANCGFVEW
ncbi:M23 family metallopeptidase [Candidatus Microgenomates bacterium]|nr:M23 family metallopeptidase [Candidatus Microgenomates bacterium]